MQVGPWNPLLLAAAAVASLTLPLAPAIDRAEATPPAQRLELAEKQRESKARGNRKGDQNSRGRTRLLQAPRQYQEPAFARGYTNGFEEGLRDGRNRNRYDPVGSRDYRSGERGYDRAYGSLDAYKDNYRAGFRKGYEAGYRDGTG